MRLSPDQGPQRLLSNLSLSVEAASGLLFYAIRRYWYIMALTTGIGLLIALFNARSAPNEFEVTASVIVPTEEYIIEFDRLHSRSFAEKVAENFRMRRIIHDDKYGWLEMYSEAPFDIVPLQFPKQLEDRNHSLRILPGKQIRVAIDAGQDSIILQGPAGSVLSASNIQLQIGLTSYYDQRHLRSRFQFHWMSRDKATKDFASRLQVSHFVQHPNLYTLYLTDLHPQLALDKMEEFLAIYIEAYRQHRYAPLLQRLRQVDAKIQLLEQEILQLKGQIVSSEITQLGSERVTIEKERKLGSVRVRIQDAMREAHSLQAYRKGELKWQEVAAACPRLDSTLPKDSVPSLPVIDSLLGASQDSLQAAEADLLTINASYLEAYDLRKVWEDSWMKSRKDSFNLTYLLRKEFETALNERARIELDTRKDMRMIVVADPPYLSRSIGRSSRMKLFLVLVLGGLMVGFAIGIVVTAFNPRIRSIAQLIPMLPEAVPMMRLPHEGTTRRQSLAAIAMNRKPEDRFTAIFGTGTAAQDLGGLLLEQELAHGNRAIWVDTLRPVPEPSPYGIPSPIPQTWWLSRDAEGVAMQLTSTHDHLILTLPAPSETPEVVGMLARATQVFIAMKPGDAFKPELRNWLEVIRRYGMNAMVIWLGS